MKRFQSLPVLLLLALLLGGPPFVKDYLYGLTVMDGHGRQINTSVIMYTTHWCPYCHKAREYFKRHAINYIEYDIETSAENLARFRDLNGIGVPMILVGDKRMQGFSPWSFDDLLK